MAALTHIRDLAKYGVLTDPDPYNLPSSAWSLGVNVRFRNGKVTGAPVFRSVLHLDTSDPRFLCATNPTTGLDLLFIGYKNGRVARFLNGATFDYSIPAYSDTPTEAAWTYTSLADVLYVNRQDREPWFFRAASDTQFHSLIGTGWDASWSALLLRSLSGALVALNVTKGGVNFPTMVKTSSIPLSGNVPSSWDHTVPATLASENILAEMRGPITDACSFGNNLCIYGLNEAHLMQADNSFNVYRTTKLPFQKGSLNANCSIEIDGKQVVFGPDDIWTHDGTSEESLCDQKTREFIYGSINLKKGNRAFVTHNAQLKELYFAYVSGDVAVGFLNAPDGCNRQAVYNYGAGTWTFDDLPLVYSATAANVNVSQTFSSITGSFDSFGGSFQDQEDGYKRTVCYVGDVNASYGLATSLYAFDLYGEGSTASYSVDTNASLPHYLERDGIDLDELNVDLRGYKTVNSVYPQARLGTDSAPLLITYGCSDYFNVPPVFSDYQPYDGAENYKLDFNAAGRYLSMKVKHADYREMSLSGFDLDLQVTGQR